MVCERDRERKPRGRSPMAGPSPTGPRIQADSDWYNYQSSAITIQRCNSMASSLKKPESPVS